MGIALFLLIKSMNRQLGKVPSDFVRSGAAPSATGAPPSVAGGTDHDPDGPPDTGAPAAVDTEADRPPR